MTYADRWARRMVAPLHAPAPYGACAPKWTTEGELLRLLDEWAQARTRYGTDKGVTAWAFDRWPDVAGRWRWRKKD